MIVPILQIRKWSLGDVKYLTKICAANEGSWGFPAELSGGGWKRPGGQWTLGLLLASSSLVHSLYAHFLSSPGTSGHAF